MSQEMIKMTEAYRAFSIIPIILSLLAITASDASAEMKHYTDYFTPVYQGKCDKNPDLPGC